MSFGSFTFGSVAFGSTETAFAIPGPETPASTGGWGGQVTIFVEIDLGTVVDGPDAGGNTYFARWGSAIWGVDQWATGIEWTDVTNWVQDIDIKAGFSRLNGSFNTGSCKINLNNMDGRFSPGNSGSPYRSGGNTTIGIWRPLRVRAEYNDGYSVSEWPLFTGYVRSWDESFTLHGHEASVSVVASDTFAKVARFENYARTPTGAGELTGARIERILDSIGYLGDRFIDLGEHTLQATDLAGNAVTLLKDTAEAEGGAVWCGPDGAIYFDGKDALIEKARSNTVQAVFADDGRSGALVYADPQPAYDGDLVVNMAAFQADGGAVQTYASTPSRVLYGDQQVTKTSLPNDDDTDVLTLARREVAVYQTPERRIASLRFNPVRQTAVAWPLLSSEALRLRALCQVVITPPSGDPLDRYVFIEGMGHKITRTNWWVDLSFSSATAWYGQVGSLWGSGTWGSSVWTF